MIVNPCSIPHRPSDGLNICIRKLRSGIQVICTGLFPSTDNLEGSEANIALALAADHASAYYHAIPFTMSWIGTCARRSPLSDEELHKPVDVFRPSSPECPTSLCRSLHLSFRFQQGDLHHRGRSSNQDTSCTKQSIPHPHQVLLQVGAHLLADITRIQLEARELGFRAYDPSKQ